MLKLDTAKIAVPTVAEVATINEGNITRALADYVAYTWQHGNIDRISEAFIQRLAHDAARAKKALRGIFRKSPGWREELQAVMLNGTQTHNPDWQRVNSLALQICARRLAHEHGEGHDRLLNAISFFTDADTTTEYVRERHFNALNELAPKAYRKGRKLSRVFNDFAKAVGVYDGAAGSEYQKVFAMLADEMNGAKLKFKMFVSINPAHFLTMSNPVDDSRGTTLVSCHSLNRTDYEYGVGNIGYARDDVSFVVFIAADPDNPETLNNRKTARQIFAYRAESGVLLQSRLYDAQGGTYGKQALADKFRDHVQRLISDGEGAINLWKTCNLRDRERRLNKYGIDFPRGEGFGGYADWREFDGEVIKLSIREDQFSATTGDFKGWHGFSIGTSGLCLDCAAEVEDGHYFCDCCDHNLCHECGERYDEDELTRAYDEDGDEVYVCEDCLDCYYCYCECCECYHHESNCTKLLNGNWVCDDCRENHYCQCDDCDGWMHAEDSYYAHHNGYEVTVCQDCWDYAYRYCEHCGEDHHLDNMRAVVEDGSEEYICENCMGDHFTRCNDCRRYFPNEEINEDGFCPYCAEKYGRQYRRYEGE